MSTTPTPTTELEAVNTMLMVIGESPVNTLIGEVNVDVALAKQILLEVSKSVQAEGWHFNTEDNYPLPPNQDGEIILPANTISVDADCELDKYDIVQRGGKLYDRRKHTFIFTEPVTVSLKVFIPFEELPEVARQYIVIRAARMFQDRLLGSEAIHTFTERDEMIARVNLLEEEGRTSDVNVFTMPAMFDVMRRHFPLRRYW